MQKISRAIRLNVWGGGREMRGRENCTTRSGKVAALLLFVRNVPRHDLALRTGVASPTQFDLLKIYLSS
jgi:hypothetical protein